MQIERSNGKKTAGKNLSYEQVAQMMYGRPDHEKIRVLRNALGDFLKYVKERGYSFDEPGNPLLDFLTDHKDGPLSGSRLIKSVLIVINAEEILDSRFGKN